MNAYRYNGNGQLDAYVTLLRQAGYSARVERSGGETLLITDCRIDSDSLPVCIDRRDMQRRILTKAGITVESADTVYWEADQDFYAPQNYGGVTEWFAVDGRDDFERSKCARRNHLGTPCRLSCGYEAVR